MLFFEIEFYIPKFLYKNFMLLLLNTLNFLLLILGAFTKISISFFTNFLGKIILLLILNVLFNEKNLALPLLMLIKVKNGLLKIMENIVP